jgi:lysophospholipase L1-like esterase
LRGVTAERTMIAVLLAFGALAADGLARSHPAQRGPEALVRPLRPRAGAPVKVRLFDTSRRAKGAASVCQTPPSGTAVCGDTQVARGRARPVLRFKVPVPGRWELGVKGAAGLRAHRLVRVRGPGQPLRLLATGDSMIQYVDSSLMNRFEPGGDVDVRSDARISTGISKPLMLNWVAHARRQAAGIRPDVTVVFIGANDGFPLRVRGGRRANCCGRAWVNGYASRVRSMMASYARRGQGEVCWLNLPAPRSANWRHIYSAVNRALRRAASSFGPEVRLVDIAKVFTPRFRFRTAMRWKGQRVVVRQSDGVHLSAAGASIAAELLARKLRADDALG